MLRIGELARRSGVSADVLRAWERRYGLFEPQRTDGGFRLYGDEDVARVRRMREHLDAGLSAAEAARLARQPQADASPADKRELLAALLAFDEVRAQAVLDRLLASYGLDAVLGDAVLPAMRGLGDRWAAGEASVAQEHFASNVVGGRLHGLARGWDRGAGPRALLALPPGERHELGLIAFGLALRAHGWRITYLGADTPVETLADTAARLQPAVVVLSGTVEARFCEVEDDLRRVAASVELALGGPGASHELAARIGARLLPPDAVAAAAAVAA